MNILSRFLSETAVSFILLLLIAWFINPFGFFMTDALHMTVLGLLAACFAVYAMLLWKEGADDERERLHRFIAARFAYTAVGMFLLTGVVLQAFAHAIDPWLPSALAIMVLAKVAGRFYARHRY